MLQMCSDWNLDQPTFEKFPALELLRHTGVRRGWCPAESDTAWEVHGPSQDLILAQNLGVFLEIIDFWVYHPSSIKCVWLPGRMLDQCTLSPPGPMCASFFSFCWPKSFSSGWMSCVLWSHVLGQNAAASKQSKNLRGKYSQCWLTQGCSEPAGSPRRRIPSHTGRGFGVPAAAMVFLWDNLEFQGHLESGDVKGFVFLLFLYLPNRKGQ